MEPFKLRICFVLLLVLICSTPGDSSKRVRSAKHFNYHVNDPSFDPYNSPATVAEGSAASSANHKVPAVIPNIASRLGESTLLPCGASEHELLKQLEASVPPMPVLVNWFKHYSLTRRSDKPIYAKYLANNIDYPPHISRDYENRLQVVDKINLNISNLKAIDEALYECRLILFDKAYADSKVGSMFYLQVHVAPEFEYPNEDIVYFKPNSLIRLYCYAKGKPTPTITWYKNGVKLDTNTSVLQEQSSQLEDSIDIFEYRCKAENIVGQIEHTVKVIRSGSLFFTEKLKNLTVTEGTILNWPCLAQSNAEITYKWFKNSVAVQSTLSRWSDRGALFQDGMLYLLETFRNDSGLYECHAYTANKRIETSAYLNVLYGPEIAEFPSPHYVIDNSPSIVLDCVVKSNPHVIALEWFKDKYLLSNTNKYQILANNSLLIKNVQRADRGNYYCTCNNTLKKTTSSVIKLEVVDPKKIETTVLYASSPASAFKLPCRSSAASAENAINAHNVKWFKLNARLPLNRHQVEADGSLNLQNLRLADSGMYLCRTSEATIKSRAKNLFSYSSERSSGSNERIIKLNIVQNKSLSDMVTMPDPVVSQEVVVDNELPASPENLQINQTTNGVSIQWTYAKKAPVKIDYFQIYFRETQPSDERGNGDDDDDSDDSDETLFKGASSEWLTSEAIDANQNSYFIDESNFVENHSYEFQMVAFSAYSKSLPSQLKTLKYLPKLTQLAKKPVYLNNPGQATVSSSLPFGNYFNLNQLDFVLIAVFLALVFVLGISVCVCVVYRRTRRYIKKKRSSKMNDGDEWGFQSSAATTTFLSSSSSSEKSLNTYKQSKTQKPPAIDCDLNLLTGRSSKKKKKSLLASGDNEHDDDTTTNHEKFYATSGSNRPNDYDNEDENDDDDGDYYYNRKLPAEPAVIRGSSVYRSVNVVPSHHAAPNSNCIASTSSGASGSSAGISSGSSGVVVSTESVGNNLIITTSKLATAANLPLEPGADANSSSTSGINSGGSCTGSSRNSTDGADDIKVVNDSILTINTIKYNAKTNTMLKPATTKKLVGGDRVDGSKTLAHLKSSEKKKQLRFQYDTIVKDRKDSGCVHAEDEAMVVENGQTRGSPSSRAMTGSRKPVSRACPLVSVKGEMAPGRDDYHEVADYHWVNDGSASPSTSSPSSVTPIESCAYSTSSLTPPMVQPARHSQRQQSEANGQHELELDSENTLPFPTSHFNLTRDQNQLQQQLMKLNSGSSLTVVSKVPSTSFSYMAACENSAMNCGSGVNTGGELVTRSTVETHASLASKELGVDPLGKKYRSKSSTNSSSSSSGCSSLDNQYYNTKLSDKQTHHLLLNSNLVIKGRPAGKPNEFIRDERQFIRTRITAGASPTRTSLCLVSCQKDGASNASERVAVAVSETLQRQLSKQAPRNYQQYSTYKPLLKASARPNGASDAQQRPSSHSTFKSNKVDYV